MQNWIRGEMNTRCHPTRLHVPCERYRGYDAILPCPQELADNLAEDYAVSKRWCDFLHPAAAIQPLTKVDAGAAKAFQRPPLRNASNVPPDPNRFYDSYKGGVSLPPEAAAPAVRLAFFFTVYADAQFVRRLLQRLYSPTHYYLLHLDASVGSVSVEFEQQMRALADSHDNVFLTKDVPIVYGASTATILLTRAMAWFDKYATGWDYFVPLTGSDYPLVPLKRIEHIFAFQQPPMPFVMAWTPGKPTVCRIADVYANPATHRHFDAYLPPGEDAPHLRERPADRAVHQGGHRRARQGAWRCPHGVQVQQLRAAAVLQQPQRLRAPGQPPEQVGCGYLRHAVALPARRVPGPRQGVCGGESLLRHAVL
jgi:hypothetical protein